MWRNRRIDIPNTPVFARVAQPVLPSCLPVDLCGVRASLGKPIIAKGQRLVSDLVNRYVEVFECPFDPRGRQGPILVQSRASHAVQIARRFVAYRTRQTIY